MLFDDFAFYGNHELQQSAYDIQQNTHYISEQQLITKRQAKRHFRRSILQAWDHLCAYCGNPGDTLDHVKPRSKGGETRRSNLICCCALHNSQKSSDDWVDWFRAQAFWTPGREADIWLWITQDHLAETEKVA